MVSLQMDPPALHNRYPIGAPAAAATQACDYPPEEAEELFFKLSAKIFSSEEPDWLRRCVGLDPGMLAAARGLALLLWTRLCYAR